MKKSYFIALVIFIVAAIWIASGVIFPSTKTAELSPSVGESTQEILTKVRVERLHSISLPKKIRFTGRSQASKRVDIKAEVAGQIQRIYFEEGKAIRKGEQILRLDQRDRQARVAETKGLVDQRLNEYKTAVALEEKGFGSNIRTRQALAALDSAKAGLKGAQIDTSKMIVKAPFDGDLTDQYVELGDYVSVGDPLFTLVDLNPIEFVGFVTEKQQPYVTKGDRVQISLLDGQTIEGSIEYISPSADQDARTFRVLIAIPNMDKAVGDGLTANISLVAGAAQGYSISPSTLALDDDGRVGVKIVNADQSVSFLPVTIVGEENRKILISGLPDQIDLITLGQAFVKDGAKVTPIYDEGR